MGKKHNVGVKQDEPSQIKQKKKTNIDSNKTKSSY